MKQLLTLLILLITLSTWSQKLPKIKGSGIVEVMDTKLIEPFNAISLDGDMEVELVQGGRDGIRIETDDNLIETVEYSIANNTLYISLSHRITKKKKLNITVTTGNIEQIELKNEANVQSNITITGKQLAIIAGKSTKYELDVAIKDGVYIEMYSDAEGVLKTKSVKSVVTLDDRASLKMYGVSDSLTVGITDYAKLALEGTMKTAILNLKKEAKIAAKDASLSQVDINLSEASDAVINVKETITLHAQDTSEIELYGNPEITVTGLKNEAKILKKE